MQQHSFQHAVTTAYLLMLAGGKVESFNPMGSVKDRMALATIAAAEASGELKPGQTVIEATSGNTEIGLAMVCAVKGYPLVVTMAAGTVDQVVPIDGKMALRYTCELARGDTLPGHRPRFCPVPGKRLWRQNPHGPAAGVGQIHDPANLYRRAAPRRCDRPV